jgi:hypothetical protein
MKEGPNLYEYVWNDPIAFVDSEGLWGAYIVGSATAEAGIRGGAAVQSGAGAGVFGGGKCGTHAGGFTDTGGFAGGGNRQQFAFGAAAGVGGGIGITNATSAGQLAGPFDTWSLNLPFVSFQFANSGGTWTASVTGGESAGLSFSRYSVTTTTTGDYGCNH